MLNLQGWNIVMKILFYFFVGGCGKGKRNYLKLHQLYLCSKTLKFKFATHIKGRILIPWVLWCRFQSFTSCLLLHRSQRSRKAAPAPCASAWMPARDMPASQPGQHIVPHQQDKWERRVQECPWPTRIWQIGVKGFTTHKDFIYYQICLYML